MLYELPNPLTMKIMALGHSLHEAQCIAGVILIQGVLLLTVMGYQVVLPEGMCRPADPDIPRRDRRIGFVCMCGIFPALTGTEADTSRALLFTQ